MENRSVPLSYRVDDKMRWSKDKRSLKVNESLTLAGIPPETFQYRLGNRSVLEGSSTSTRGRSTTASALTRTGPTMSSTSCGRWAKWSG